MSLESDTYCPYPQGGPRSPSGLVDSPRRPRSAMTSQGTAARRFTRAIERRNLFQAELALREMGTPALTLAALELIELPQPPRGVPV